MTTPFVPHKPEEEVTVKIRKREAILIQKLRKYPFGKFTIVKADGLIVDLVINDRQRITEDDNLNL